MIDMVEAYVSARVLAIEPDPESRPAPSSVY